MLELLIFQLFQKKLIIVKHEFLNDFAFLISKKT